MAALVDVFVLGRVPVFVLVFFLSAGVPSFLLCFCFFVAVRLADVSLFATYRYLFLGWS